MIRINCRRRIIDAPLPPLLHTALNSILQVLKVCGTHSYELRKTSSLKRAVEWQREDIKHFRLPHLDRKDKHLLSPHPLHHRLSTKQKIWKMRKCSIKGTHIQFYFRSDSLLLSLPPPFHQVMLYGITGAWVILWKGRNDDLVSERTERQCAYSYQSDWWFFQNAQHGSRSWESLDDHMGPMANIRDYIYMGWDCTSLSLIWQNCASA